MGMRIGINALFLRIGKVGGTETYSVSLIEALSKQFPEDTYVIFANHNASQKLKDRLHEKNIELVSVLGCETPASRYVWEQVMLPLLAKLHRINVLHSLGYTSPLFAICPTIVTIHDLNAFQAPGTFSPTKALLMKVLLRISAWSAKRIIAVSYFTKEQLMKVLSVKEEKISVVYESIKNRRENSNDEAVKEAYGIKAPYIFTIGNVFLAHKNIERLIRAYKKLRTNASVPHHLVIAGNSNKKIIYEPKNGEVQDVHFLGYVADEDVPALYRGASVFVFPSLYEGFGIPLLEAMKYNVPVIASTAGSLPEIAGPAACYIDPHSEDDIAEKIEKVLNDDRIQRQLKEEGLKRQAAFSWEESARKTHDVYLEFQKNTQYE